VYVNYGVLVGAFVFEAWALYKANKAIKGQMEERGWESYREAFRKTSDITTLTALTEDTIALVGVTLAFFGIVLTELTGNPVYDAVSALLIGLLLMGFALALAWENKRLLLGESLPESRVEDLRNVVRTHEGVDHLVDFRTVYIGPEELLVTADVTFDDALETDDIEALIDRVEAALVDHDSHPPSLPAQLRQQIVDLLRLRDDDRLARDGVEGVSPVLCFQQVTDVDHAHDVVEHVFVHRKLVEAAVETGLYRRLEIHVGLDADHVESGDHDLLDDAVPEAEQPLEHPVFGLGEHTRTLAGLDDLPDLRPRDVRVF